MQIAENQMRTHYGGVLTHVNVKYKANLYLIFIYASVCVGVCMRFNV